MDEPFFIPVIFKGVECQFEAKIQRLGYSPALQINVEGNMVIYERDEEGNFRALIMPEEKEKSLDRELLEVIGKAIEEILR